MKYSEKYPQCKKMVMSLGGWYSRQCYRKSVKDGYCKQHHPDSVKARREASIKRYEEKQKHSIYTRYSDLIESHEKLKRGVRSLYRRINLMKDPAKEQVLKEIKKLVDKYD